VSWVSAVWDFYQANTLVLAPLGTILVGLGTFIVGIGSMWVARKQAQTAAKSAQIAERQASTAAFFSGVNRLTADKPEERLGGIYILERISKDSPDDYWTVMETLAAFARERRPPPEKPDPSKVAGLRPPTDRQAVLDVIRRRHDADREREQQRGWRFDLRWADLRFIEAPLAHLEGAHLEGADLSNTRLEGTHLEGAWLWEALLAGAHLEGAHLQGAHLEGAVLLYAHLEGAHLEGAHLKGAHLDQERPYTLVDLTKAIGDAKTELPDGIARPEHWPAYEPDDPV
jgi:hypothetical protein